MGAALTPVIEIVFSLIGLLLIALLICANVWNARRRAKMTPAERDADDAEDRRETNIW